MFYSVFIMDHATLRARPSDVFNYVLLIPSVLYNLMAVADGIERYI